MIINKLVLQNLNGDIIRDVDFQLGLNLIVDNDGEEKGNNVGKTTLLRCIDYCLGSEGSDIFKDRESKSINNTILSFLQNTYIYLYLTNTEGKQVVLKRNFPTARGEGIFEVDGINYGTLRKYTAKLNEIFYKNEINKPTFRSLIGKFVRLDDFRMSNILNFDYPTTSLEKYQLLHSYLFGFNNFEVLETQVSLRKDIYVIKEQIRHLKSVASFKNENALTQSIIIYDKNIAELQEKIDKINIEQGNNDILDEIKGIRDNIALISLELSKTNTEISFHQKSKSKLEKELKIADKDYIKSIYEQAKIYVPDLQKTYEEVLTFHNSVIIDRISLVQSSLKELFDKSDALKIEKSNSFQKETKLLNMLGGEYDSDLEVLRDKQKELFEEKGKLVNVQVMLKTLGEQGLQKNKHLEQVEAILAQEIVKLQTNLISFNEFFNQYSKLVCDKDLFVSADYNDNGMLKYDINNLPGNDGTGEKKSQIAVFDFAYVDFINKESMNGPRFVIHDNIESKDNSHLKKVFDLANNFSGQYIVSIIKNRVSSFLTDEEIEKYSVINLNSKDKFFRI